jgi:S-adenosyl-L-methionine hydrolase (adenosine-forming)
LTADTVFFCSDYGTADGFVGVVHAVLRRLAPHAVVVDLCHEVPPFDVRAGADLLARELAHLGPGVVLAVVDPGVGSERRGLAVEAGGPGPTWFVGPDNGLLLPALERAGGARRAVALGPSGGPAVTFDGRDVFAPAAGALCGDTDLGALGDPVDLSTLCAVAPFVVEHGALDDGRRLLRCEITWVDRFGNLQLAGRPADLDDGVVFLMAAVAGAGHADRVARVATFADLAPGQTGLLVDADGRLALVVREGSAALALAAASGDLVELVW